MTLALILGPVVVPGLVAVRRPLPGVLEDSVDHRFADQDAQVHYEKGVHGPARTEESLMPVEEPPGHVLHSQLL